MLLLPEVALGRSRDRLPKKGGQLAQRDLPIVVGVRLTPEPSGKNVADCLPNRPRSLTGSICRNAV